jgi:hypothetical protein
LDLACGTGIVARVVAARVGRTGAVVGVDLNPGMLKVAAAAVLRQPQDDATVEWREASADKLPFLLQAQSSKAKIIGLANAGGDTVNSIKQAAEFGVTQGGQNLAGLLMFITDIHSLGLASANGLLLTEAWYWDSSDEARKFAGEFGEANKAKPPTSIHAGVYSSITHYGTQEYRSSSGTDSGHGCSSLRSSGAAICINTRADAPSRSIPFRLPLRVSPWQRGRCHRRRRDRSKPVRRTAGRHLRGAVRAGRDLVAQVALAGRVTTPNRPQKITLDEMREAGVCHGC